MVTRNIQIMTKPAPRTSSSSSLFPSLKSPMWHRHSCLCSWVSLLSALCVSALSSLFFSSSHPRGKIQNHHPQNNPVNRKWRKSPPPHPTHKPRHRSIRHHKRHRKPNPQHNPSMPINMRNRNPVPMFPHYRLQQVITSRHHHRRYRKEKRKLQRRRPRHPRQLPARNRRHRPRSPRKHRRQYLASPNPNRLPQTHILHMPRLNNAALRPFSRRLRLCVPRIHKPHHNPANQQRAPNDVQTLQMLPDNLRHQKRRYRRHHKRNNRELHWTSPQHRENQALQYFEGD